MLIPPAGVPPETAGSDTQPGDQASAEPLGRLGVTLEELPFAAALIDGGGTLIAANSRWASTHPSAPPGTSLDDWCHAIHDSATALRNALVAGTRETLAGTKPLFTQHFEGSERRRVMVSPHSAGALVCFDKLLTPDEQRNLQSQKMETVGRLVGGVVHDFANLLTLIAGYSDILLSRASDHDPLRPEIEEIRRAANRGARLTGQLLGFTRGQSADPHPLDLNALVSDMQRMLRPIIGEYVGLEAYLAADLGRVLAGTGQMEQVLMNLILNARDAMPRGGRIRIETRNHDLDETAAALHGIPPGPYVLLSITDTGHGIDADAIDRVFQPFFTTKPGGKGTGLGLSTVQSIVRQAGGEVWVRSAPGEGASFTLCLPRIAFPAQNVETAAVARPELSGSETLLLVEDEEGVRRLLTHVLRRRGYQVLEARDGEEALVIFRQRHSDIHLVLTDMVMPGMSGRELGERVREFRPDMRVIYMSGYTDDVLVRTGALGPGMSFLQKPLRPDMLAAKVREALDSPSQPFDPA